MQDDVMIISTSESFAVKSMETKLDTVGIHSYQVFPKISDIGNNPKIEAAADAACFILRKEWRL